MYPTHYVGDNGYISDTEYTLAHDGKSLDSFREMKELEKAKPDAKFQKTEADVIQPPSNLAKPQTDAIQSNW